MTKPIRCCIIDRLASVAQSVVQLIRNQQVVCSSHITSSKRRSRCESVFLLDGRFLKGVMAHITAQIVSILALCVLFISYQCKETKKLCIVQGVSSSLFALSYFLLGAYTGCILNVINIFRGIFFGFAPKKRQNVLLIVLALMYIAATAVTYSDFFSLLILVAQLVGAFSVWLGDGKKLRILQLCVVSPVWLIYNIKVVSIGGIVGESFSIFSVIISFIRFGADGFSESGGKKKPRK